MKRGVSVAVLVPRILVASLLLLALLAAFKWGQFSRHVSLRTFKETEPLSFSSNPPTSRNTSEPVLPLSGWPKVQNLTWSNLDSSGSRRCHGRRACLCFTILSRTRTAITLSSLARPTSLAPKSLAPRGTRCNTRPAPVAVSSSRYHFLVHVVALNYFFSLHYKY